MLAFLAATALANRSLWEAHAEERVAFDSKLDLHELSGTSYAYRSLTCSLLTIAWAVVDEIMPLRQVRAFSIAVPNVNVRLVPA